MREEISKILVKWNMPTRQAAISELVAFVEKAILDSKKPSPYASGSKPTGEPLTQKNIEEAKAAVRSVRVKPKVTRFDYQDVCGDCGRKLYGAPRREMGAITVSMGICENCHQEKGIVPARDWHFAYEDRVTVEDWD